MLFVYGRAHGTQATFRDKIIGRFAFVGNRGLIAVLDQQLAGTVPAPRSTHDDGDQEDGGDEDDGDDDCVTPSSISVGLALRRRGAGARHTPERYPVQVSLSLAWLGWA
jgi:hypothetical protein